MSNAKQPVIVDVECNIMRPQSLDGPRRWAKGDFTKTLSDGAQASATYEEYAAFIGCPGLKGEEIME